MLHWSASTVVPPCVDFLTLEKSKGEIENVLVVTDRFSRYAQAYPTKNLKANTVARVLWKNFCQFGLPAKLHTDQVRSFESAVVRGLCKCMGIPKTHHNPLPLPRQWHYRAVQPQPHKCAGDFRDNPEISMAWALRYNDPRIQLFTPWLYWVYAVLFDVWQTSYTSSCTHVWALDY